MKLIKKLLKVEVTYALLFFSTYIYFFIGMKSAVAFGVGYVLVILISLLYKTFKNNPFLYGLLYPIIFFSGFHFFGVNQLIGFLLGTSIACYLVLNYKLIKMEDSNYKDKLAHSAHILKNVFVFQVLYSFYFFYNQIILDIRGQNKLDEWNIIIVTSTLILSLWLLQVLANRFLKKVDIISYSNVIILCAIGMSVAMFYKPFVEVGTLNIILPFITGFIGITLVSIATYLNSSHTFRFRRTLTTLAYTIIPLTLIIYYPWNISKYLGVAFATLGVILLHTDYFESRVKNHELVTRIVSIKAFSTNIFLFLGTIFTLSAGGLITKLNIANLDYLIMLIAGVFLVYLMQDLRETLQERIAKRGLVGVFSVATIALSSLSMFLLLDVGKVEALGAFLFGIFSFIFVKNNFSLRSFEKDIKSKDIAYTYLENSLLNLLTVLAVSLILVKI